MVSTAAVHAESLAVLSLRASTSTPSGAQQRGNERLNSSFLSSKVPLALKTSQSSRRAATLVTRAVAEPEVKTQPLPILKPLDTKRNENWLDIGGCVVIVTGGGSGIGRAVCLELAANGAVVVIADRSPEKNQKVLEELNHLYPDNIDQHMCHGVDVSNVESVNNLLATVIEKYGRIDILVNNAGINIPRLLVDPAGQEELTEEIWDQVSDVNMKGCFLMAQAVAREMIKACRPGVIINMASESGLEGSEGQSVYAATKAALYSMTRSWAKELGKHAIRVVGLAPGILRPTGLRSPEYERALAYTRGTTVEAMKGSYGSSNVPLGRPGALEEVANAVAFLASQRSSYVDGTVLNVSGGKSRA
eukprot:jgi/Chlat1/3236/Chrsp22S03508